MKRYSKPQVAYGRMQGLSALSVALLCVLALGYLPSAAADVAPDQHEYLDVTGRFDAGIPTHRIEGVNMVAFHVTPIEGFHHLRLALGFDPQGFALDTPALEATVFHRLEVRLFDALTGTPLTADPYRYHGNGTYVYVAPDEAPIRVELSLAQGAQVEYAFRINALPDPQPIG